ncbi:regulatory protein RecX [Parvibacter caecicola]|uniref:regulatory protein RecX n=1 Tax=Parvibacter caecicola TaxID=747645 RepID=UPI0023F01B10|nr:RecX family transcriptional regulator [Parvibacter caecicola]
MGRPSQIEVLKARIAEIEAGRFAAAEDEGGPVQAAGAPSASPFVAPCGGGRSSAPAKHRDDEDSPSGREAGAGNGEKPKDAQAAYQRILRIVATREQSSAKVREKLLRAEFPPDAAEEAIERAQRLGVIDDARYCDALIRSALRNDKGVEGVLREAVFLGVNLEALDSYQAYLEDGEEGQLSRACAYLEAHPVRSKNQRDGAFRKLVSRGFSVSVASAAARSVYPYQPS